MMPAFQNPPLQRPDEAIAKARAWAAAGGARRSLYDNILDALRSTEPRRATRAVQWFRSPGKPCPGLDRARYEQHAHHLLRTAGLEGFLGKYPFELSGGMQQRVALCRALVAEPSLLLMDEPFGSLDALTRQKMGFELLRLWQEWKSTVLFVTHDIVESIILADRVVVMSPRPGRIIDVMPVELPRPRDLLMQDTPAFTRLASRIRLRLWEEETADA